MAEREQDVDPAVLRHPAWSRLEEQLSWYDRASRACQRKYKGIKIVQIVLAAAIPLLVFLDTYQSKWLTAIAGSAIALLEGIQQLGQYSSLWITYRATAEYLKHEKHLFLASAGPYRELALEKRLPLLAERVEERVSAEHANWVNENRKGMGSDR